MNRLRLSAVLLALAASITICPGAFAWGCDGHQTVALIAKQNLNPHALAMVNQILTDNPIDPGLDRFCQPVATDPMANAATWADDYRAKHPNTGAWHFIDIPRGAAKGSFVCDPATSCITLALAAQIKVLQTPGSSAADQANALRFIIHFAGDIHQPLHCTTNNDRGANCVPVTFFGKKPVETDHTSEGFAPNLHGVWDSDLVERIESGKTVDQFAAALNTKFHPQFAAWQAAGINFDDWAWDSHEDAESISYGKLNKKIPIEAPLPVTTCADANHVSTRMLAFKEKVSSSYKSHTAPTIEEQIAKAGLRLSMILNQIWP
ncbi:MAG: S1/P1 nuclease [Candidatus Acidiferrales bacterium]